MTEIKLYQCQSCHAVLTSKPHDSVCEMAISTHDYEEGWSTKPCGGTVIELGTIQVTNAS